MRHSVFKHTRILNFRSNLCLALFLILAILSPQLKAQQFTLQTWSVDAGLAQSQVYALCEDSRGYMWIGTRGGGLSKFDGISFTTYTEQDGLPGNYISCILEDVSGMLWIGTTEGLTIYDGKYFEIFSDRTGGVSSIAQDRDGRIWVGSEKGIDIIWKENETWETIHWGKSEGLLSEQIYSILKTENGQMWIGTNRGLNIFDPRKNTLDQPNLTWVTRANGLLENHVQVMLEDGDGKIWLGLYGGGVQIYDKHKASTSNPWPFERLTMREGLPGNIVLSLEQDRNDNIWIGTLENGAVKYDGKFFTRFTEESGLGSNHVRTLLQDSWGNMWLGTSGGGVSKFSGERFVHFDQQNGLAGSRVYAIAKDSLSQLWLGTSGGGVNIFDGKSFTYFTKSDGFTNEIVKCLYRDRWGTMWLGTEGQGLWKYDGEEFVQKKVEDGLSNPWVRGIIEDKKGMLWIATAGGGICRYNGKGFQCFTKNDGLPSNRINCLIESDQGKLYVGTSDEGIAIFNGKRFEPLEATESSICATAIRSVAKDKFGNMWFGTAEGLVQIQPAKGKMQSTKCYTIADGLSSNNIYLTLFDKEGNLWTGTEKGIDQLSFNAQGNIVQVRHFGKSEGFMGVETCQRSAFLESTGNIWFGTVGGLTKFNPRESDINSTAPKTHISSIHLLYESIDTTAFADSLRNWFPIPVNLNLPHNKNQLSFQFVGINFSNPEKVKYKWWLEGLEEKWSPITAKQEVSYSNLGSGDYTFHVKAANEDGIWNEESTRFSFSINPPIWATWWFRITLGSVVILLIWGFFKRREKNIRNENEERNRKIENENQMLELEQKALRLQMNPHFIFNALNSIKGCIASNDQAAARKHLVNFAKLMRLTLDNSSLSFVAVESEVQMLTLYMELERLSRNDDFEYKIEVDPEINPEMIGIPPMVVQPFVENAILHGISGLSSGGKVEIHFLMEENKVRCRVKDNGVGREKSLSEKTDTLHQSKGISVTEERLKLLTETGKSEFKIRFIDLMNEEGKASGTLVKIDLPYEEL